MRFQVVTASADSLQRDLDDRDLDVLILRKLGPFAEDRLRPRSGETVGEEERLVAMSPSGTSRTSRNV